MPIRREEWEKGRRGDTIESIVEEFLRKNVQNAYTSTEITDNLYNTKIDNFGDIVRTVAASYAVSEALKKLVAEKVVKARVVRGLSGSDTYYTLAE